MKFFRGLIVLAAFTEATPRFPRETEDNAEVAEKERELYFKIIICMKYKLLNSFDFGMSVARPYGFEIDF